ncbi:MAG: nitroreductase family protein [Acholeplasmataceae bacterium]|jgi:nitroreductase|nr:nitroreductase family protein [Acholeplasmataceae bacterium]
MIDAISKRTSVRTYLKKNITPEDHKKILKIIDEVKQLKGPFGHHIELFYYETPRINDSKTQIGTYGFIKNYKSFIVGKVKNTFEGLVDFGYLFELVILKLTQMKLGTVWLGGTFNRTIFDPMKSFDEVIPAITPVGYPSDKKSIREVIIRRASKGDLRNKFSELFFNQNFNHPLSEDHSYAEYLNFVRIGPSASNKQPWRCIVEDQQIHLYLERTPNYAKSLPYDIQALDIGIAICHLTEGLKSDSKTYEFVYHIDMDPHLDLFKVLTIKIN